MNVSHLCEVVFILVILMVSCIVFVMICLQLERSRGNLPPKTASLLLSSDTCCAQASGSLE